MTRDYYIDNIRGLVTLSVVFIHTVFWSGYSYVPEYIRNIALFIDVPLFFLLTGMAASMTENFNPAKQIYKLISYFTVFVFIVNIATGNSKIEYILSALTLQNAITPIFPVVDGSYWFVPVYCVCIILFSIIKDFNIFSKWLFLLLSLTYFIIRFYKSVPDNLFFLGSGLDKALFYTSCILIGFMFYKYKNNKLLPILSVTSGILLFLIYHFDHNAINLQSYKFPVGLPYVLASFISLFLVLYGIGLKSKSFLTYIGRNSLFFYMSQGVSSSLIYYVIPHINVPYIYKLIIIFSINLMLSLLIGLAIIQLTNVLTTGTLKIKKAIIR